MNPNTNNMIENVNVNVDNLKQLINQIICQIYQIYQINKNIDQVMKQQLLENMKYQVMKLVC